MVLKGEGEGARHETPGRAGFHVGGWWVEPKAGQLVKGRQVVRLEPKAMEVLNYLVARAGEVVSREELERDVWRGALVGYDAVTKTVIKLRKALGDSAHEPAFIQTVPKRGYRLVAPVDTTAPAECGPVVVPARLERPPAPIRQRILVTSGLVLIVAAAALALLYRAGSLPGTAPSGSADTVLGVEAPGRGSPTVAVLPFEVLGADQDQLYLARGLTADLISDLSSLSGLDVMGTATGPEISRGSGVGAPDARYQVWGGVQRIGDRISAEVQLIDAATQRRLWVERYDRPFSDLFEIQDEMGTRLAQALSVRVTEAERQRIAHRYTRSVDAYDLFLRSQAELLVRGPEENARARNLYLRALTLDPAFARAYGGLALTYAADYRNQWSADRDGALTRALDLAQSALEIDPTLPEIHWVLGYVEVQRRRHREALAHLGRALELDPSFADALALKGGIQTYLGDPAATIPLVRDAMRRNPGAGYLYFMILGRAYYFLDDQVQAVINLREAILRNSGILEVRVYLAAALDRSGDRQAAEWEAEEIRAIDPNFSAQAWLETYPMTDPRQRERLISALDRLGL